MGLKDQEPPETAEVIEESTVQRPPVNTFRAARQLERFMMGSNPGFRLGVDDLGDEHLSLEELADRRSREASAHRDPESFGKLIATITYFPDQRRVGIKRVDENSKPESL